MVQADAIPVAPVRQCQVPAEANEGLFAGIREVIEPEFGGKIDIDRVVALYVAGRTDG